MRKEGSNTRVLSRVRGTFCSFRFFAHNEKQMGGSDWASTHFLRQRVVRLYLRLCKPALQFVLALLLFLLASNLLSLYLVFDGRWLEPTWRHF